VEVNTDAGDITECSLDDQPTTGVFGFYDVLDLCFNFAHVQHCCLEFFCLIFNFFTLFYAMLQGMNQTKSQDKLRDLQKEGHLV